MAPREVQPPKTTAEIGPRREAAKKVRDDLKTALGQEGLTDKEYTAIQKQYEAAKTQYNLLDDLYGKAKDKEDKLGREQKLKQNADEETKRIIGIAEQKAIDKAKSFSDDPNNPNKKGLRDTAYSELNKLYDQADAKFVKLPRIIAPIEGGGFGLVTAEAVPASVAETVATPKVATPRVLTRAESEALATGRQLPEPTVADTLDTNNGLKDMRAKRADVTAGLAALKLPDTAANRQTVRDQIKAGKLPNIRNLPADISGATGGASGFDAGWQDRFKKEYPAYAWMLTELDQTKYSDLFQLMNDAVKPGSEYTDELFQRKFIGTSWYTELAAGQTGRALTTAIGSYSWGEGQLAKFLTTATRMGYKDATLKSKAYEALFSKGADGKYVNPNAIGEVKASSQFLAIKKIGTSFLTPISDESVIDTLVGGRSSDDLMRTSRELAKAKYPHLASAIDAGVTLEDVTYGYKRDAAELLEVDANTIDMSAGGYSAALGSMKDPMMSTAEWAAYIKGTPSFGWQFTKQANDQATDIGLSLARAFGKVK
jgi:hypothetical protein